ncbi:hypothetical protein LCGC14_2588790 [marine sediment metagenome]|uniref:Transposase IS204/IS1001/IS1096/IS1165 helix-turn-helix domain-containing protein n=1 Tax=marine sediment metagenome TaxID=412755 RepID=A0A0F9CNC1_9ZZZZ
MPRLACRQYGKTRQVTVPWAHSGSGFTQLFDAFVIALVRELLVNTVADMLGVGDGRVWRILPHYVEGARTHEDFSGVNGMPDLIWMPVWRKLTPDRIISGRGIS